MVPFGPLEPPPLTDKKNNSAKFAQKVSIVEAFGLGYEISTKNLIKGLIIIKICDSGRFPIYSHIKY